jgi:hypothetical protein
MRKLTNNDPRAQPAPEGAYKEQRSVRLSDHRYQQLRAEVDDPANNMSRQDIIDTALDEYFTSRYAGEGNPTA